MSINLLGSDTSKPVQTSCPVAVFTGRLSGSDGGETDDAAAADGGRPAVVGAGGELHGT